MKDETWCIKYCNMPGTGEHDDDKDDPKDPPK
jgi:hypothetical protein